MTHYAYLNVDLKCPNCNNLFADMLWFQWGYCPGYAPRDEFIYHIGDSIYWKKCKDDTVPSWTYFEGGGANIGEYSIKNLIVKDSAQYFLKQSCTNCGLSLGGAALRISDNVIVNAWLFGEGELEEEADIFISTDDNSVEPKINWNDHPMDTVKDC